MLAKELEGKGLTELEIASSLGVSQSAVSKYKRAKLKLERLFLEDERLLDKVRTVASGLAEKSMTKFQALGELMALIYEYEDRGKICNLHERLMPELAGLNCDLCIKLAKSEVLEEQEVLSNVRRAVRLLESLQGFPTLIPNVGSNIAMAKEGAKEITDVAAIPGRIYEVKGIVKVPAPPEFGASKHVAELVLAVLAWDQGRRAAVNIAWNKVLIDSCKTLGLELMEIDASYEGRRERIVKAIGELGKVPDVIYHKGAHGIEPITYLTGSNAVEVANKVGKVLEVLTKGGKKSGR